MLVRSVRTGNACNFQDMWNSRKAAYAPASDFEGNNKRLLTV